jgi:hypothetical protein
MSESDKNDEGWVLDIETLLENGVSSLLKEPEIAGACKGWLRDEIGCKPPINHGLFFCFRKALDFTVKGTSVGVGSRLLVLAQKNRHVGKFLSFLADTSRAASERSAFKAKILDAYNCKRSDDELRADAGTPIEVVVALRQGQMLDELQETLGTDFNDLLRDMRDEFNAHVQTMKDVSYKWERNTEAGRSAATSVKYDSGMYPLVGRDVELDILRAFLGDLSLSGPKHQFRWLCLTGEGGEGKTRLAFDFLTERLPAGWTGGLLTRPSMEKLTIWQNWLPAAPTLLVIDYPAQNPRLVGELLNTLMLRSDEFSDPVRVLLLERNASGPWYDEMIGAKTSDAKLKNHIFRREQFENGWELPPLKPEVIVELMRARFERDGLEAPAPDVLLAAATRVDPRQIAMPDSVRAEWIEQGTSPEKIPTLTNKSPRALFAVSTAELAVRSALESGRVLKDPFENVGRKEVLDEILTRERKEVWRKAIPQTAGDPDILLEAHENLLAFATLTRGITREQINECSPETQNELPGRSLTAPIRWNKNLIDRMGSHDADKALRGMEPDLLGEYFVFQVFRRISDSSVVASFLGDAFKIRPEETALTLILVLRDYPEELSNYDYFQPERSAGNAASLAWITILKEVVVHLSTQGDFEALEFVLDKASSTQSSFPDDVRFALEEQKALINGVALTGEHQDWERFDKLIQRATKLQDLFPDDASIALQYMTILSNGVARTGEHQHWERFEKIVQRAATLQSLFPADSDIALLEMGVLVNGVLYAGEYQEWERFDKLLQRTEALHGLFPHDAAIAVERMKGLNNGIGHTSKYRSWERFDELVQHAAALQSRFPDNEAITLYEMKSLVNGVNQTGNHVNWGRFDKLVQRAELLQSLFPRDAAIALEEMKALTNGINDTGERQVWERFDRLVQRAEVLQGHLPHDATIALQCMKVFSNGMNHASEHRNWQHFDKLAGRAATLQKCFPSNATIALENMKGLAIGLARTNGHQDGKRFDRLFQHVTTLQGLFSGDAAIALEAIRVLKNGAYDAGKSQDWKRFDRLARYAAVLQRNFPDDAAIAFEEMAVLVNGVYDAGAHKEWSRFDRLLQRAAKLQGLFPDNTEIALHEMKALINGVIGIGDYKNWKRFDSLLQRAAALQAAFSGQGAVIKLEMEALRNGVLRTGKHEDWERTELILHRALELAQCIPLGPEHTDELLNILIGAYWWLHKKLPKQTHALKDLIGSTLMSESVLRDLIRMERYNQKGISVISDALNSSETLEVSEAFEAYLRKSNLELGDIPPIPDQ